MNQQQNASVEGEASTPGESISLEEQRRRLYGIYDSVDSMEMEMEKYGVERIPSLPQNTIRTAPPATQVHSLYSPSTNVSLSGITIGSPVTIQPPPNSSNGSSNSGTAYGTPTTSATTAGRRDIYGRFPPKEPKEMIPCPVCSRGVNTLRFALHLDKCMGMGNTTRAAASGGTRSGGASASMNPNQYQQQQQQQ